MIPEQFKVNTILKVSIYGHEVDVNYAYYWPRIKEQEMRLRDEDPLVCHMEFRSPSKIISDTGYQSHFFYSGQLENTDYSSVQDLAVAIGELLARENGYEPPSPASQLKLF